MIGRVRLQRRETEPLRDLKIKINYRVRIETDSKMRSKEGGGELLESKNSIK